MFGDGEQTRDYVYVGDVAAAFLAATESAAARDRSTSAPGVETTVIELGRMIGSRDRASSSIPSSLRARLGEVQRIAIDSGAARNELGWDAATALPDGIAVTAEALRDI